jgi:hypothetical protein
MVASWHITCNSSSSRTEHNRSGDVVIYEGERAVALMQRMVSGCHHVVLSKQTDQYTMTDTNDCKVSQLVY